MKKKNRRVVILISAILVLWGGLYFYSSGAKQVKDNLASDNELENLLKTFGFFTPPLLPRIEDVVFYDLNRKAVKLTDYKGAIVFLNFWATWCPPCREEMPAMQQLYDRYEKAPFQMVAVSIKESPAEVASFFKGKRLSFTPLLDPTGEAGKKFGVNSIPTTFILDKSGKVIGKAIGPRDWGSRKSRALIQHLVSI